MPWMNKILKSNKVTTIDLIQLRKYEGYSGGSDATLIETLLDLYLQRAPDVFYRIEGAFSSGDIKSLKTNAHTLKSISATMGARKLSQICQWIELRIDENNIGMWSEEALIKLEFEFVKVIDELHHIFGLIQAEK